MLNVPERSVIHGIDNHIRNDNELGARAVQPDANPDANFVGPTIPTMCAVPANAETKINEVSSIISKGDSKPTVLSADQMRAYLNANFPDEAKLVKQILHDKVRVAALNRPDLLDGKTTLEHIIAVSQAPKLLDGSDCDGKTLATTLLRIAGKPNEATFGKCYGKTINAVWTKYHSGEFTRIIVDLALHGKVTLASGQRVTWDPQTLALPVEVHVELRPELSDFLWGHLCTNMRLQKLPDTVELKKDDQFAHKAQMANVITRLSGKAHVNVRPVKAKDGSTTWSESQMQTLGRIVKKYGPGMAEFNVHAGSVESVEGKTAYSLETGGDVDPRQNLGYVVLPKEAVASCSDLYIEHYANDLGYCHEQ